MERRCRVVAAALFGAAMVWVPNAEAEQFQVSGLTGTALLEACQSGDPGQHGFCLGYIAGIADSVSASGKRSPVTACIPASVTQAQIVDTAVEYLREHPRETRSYSGAVLVLEAIRKAFRCR
jgi:Ssp1 endopeptidase immunity protein Rap1a